MTTRRCIDCRCVVFACNGMAAAGDFVLAQSGKLDWRQVRELCGRCADVRVFWFIPPPSFVQILDDFDGSEYGRGRLAPF